MVDSLFDQIDDKRKPFTETIISANNIVIRRFDNSYPGHLFKWHYDNENRIIIPLNNSDWHFQFDNQIPIKLIKDKPIKINTGIYHRLIKGKYTKNLNLKILLNSFNS